LRGFLWDADEQSGFNGSSRRIHCDQKSMMWRKPPSIAATGVLMMRYRKRWLAKINIAFTNRITTLFAGWLPGFGILTHVGRRSAMVHRTPVNVFQTSKGFIIALTYSSQSEWVKNVLAAGGCELKTCGKQYQLSTPKVVRDPTRRWFPLPMRIVLRIVGADEYMELSVR
jgi:deazaflavin-dependent oxidoreductase (nitroreductase family)